MKTSPIYAELHAKTAFSFLMGAATPEEMVNAATLQNLHSIAITDINGVYALPRAYKALQDLKKAEETTSIDNKSASPNTTALICGATLVVENHLPMSLLAQNRKGYATLCRIITAAHAQKEKGTAAIGLNTLEKLLSEFSSDGLYALPHLPQATHQRDPLYPQHQQALDLEYLRSIFPNRVALTLSLHEDGFDSSREQIIAQASSRYNIPVIASNTPFYHQSSRHRLHDIFSSMRHLKPVSKLGRLALSNSTYGIASNEVMLHRYRHHPDSLTRTLEIAESCEFSLSQLRYRYPSEWIPSSHTAQSYLRQLTFDGAKRRYDNHIPEPVTKQLEHELKLIETLSFADYFLTIWDIVEFARSQKILCQGRGSAANSAVCFCLHITAIDPVRMNLLFERFISVERAEPPDIDVDFEHERREEVIQYIYQKYGRDRAGMVSAVVCFRHRMAKREVRKALELPEISTRQKSHSQPNAYSNVEHQQYIHPNNSPKESNDASSHLLQVSQEQLREQLAEELATEIEGFPRHLSIHSGGFTLSADPIIETVPIEPARMEGRTIVQWDKTDLEIIGLLKVDILALGILSAIHKTFDLIELTTQKRLSLATIPAEDPITYAHIQRADTVGTFQIESRAQMSMLPRLLPKTFYDLVIQVAIVRPGPIQGGMVHPYLKRRKGLEPVELPDPRLKPILEKTLGVPLFQEQVMKIAIELAQFSPGEADQLRRAIGSWGSGGRHSDTIEAIGKKLMKGLLAEGIPLKFAEQIFAQIRGFADYGFPESHAASFALIAYASAYLKTHHPAEYVCSLINSQPMGFYSIHSLVEDAKRHGVAVLPLHPDFSQWDCTLEVPSKCTANASPKYTSAVPQQTLSPIPQLRIGFRTVHGISKSDYVRIDSARQNTHLLPIKPSETKTFSSSSTNHSSPSFTSLTDFINKTKIKIALQQTLAMGNFFNPFKLSQREALWEILRLHSLHFLSSSHQPQQLSLPFEPGTPQGNNSCGFSPSESIATAGPNGAIVTRKSQFENLSLFEEIQSDYKTYGLSTRGHPMVAIRASLSTGTNNSPTKKSQPHAGLQALPKTTSQTIRGFPNGRTIDVSGLVIVRQRPPTAKGVTFATLEDEFGFIDLIFKPEVYDAYKDTVFYEAFLIIRGRLQKDGQSMSVLVSQVKRLIFEH